MNHTPSIPNSGTAPRYQMEIHPSQREYLALGQKERVRTLFDFLKKLRREVARLKASNASPLGDAHPSQRPMRVASRSVEEINESRP